MSAANRVFLVLALVLLGAGAVMAAKNLWLIESGRRAQGQVIALTARPGSGTGTAGATYAPVIAFTDADGARVTFTAGLSGNVNPGPGKETAPPYGKGDRVTVIYDPQHPERARLAGPLSLWLFPGAFIGIGALLLFGIWMGARRKAG